MARDAALIVTWGATVPGREGKSLEVFMEYMGWLGKLAAEGKIEKPELFFSVDGSGAVEILKGKSDTLLQILETDESQKFFNKGQLIVQDLKAHLYIQGTDQEIQRGTGIFSQAAQELGMM